MVKDKRHAAIVERFSAQFEEIAEAVAELQELQDRYFARTSNTDATSSKASRLTPLPFG